MSEVIKNGLETTYPSADGNGKDARARSFCAAVEQLWNQASTAEQTLIEAQVQALKTNTGMTIV
jgi:hypothetical protein